MFEDISHSPSLSIGTCYGTVDATLFRIDVSHDSDLHAANSGVVDIVQLANSDPVQTEVIHNLTDLGYTICIVPRETVSICLADHFFEAVIANQISQLCVGNLVGFCPVHPILNERNVAGTELYHYLVPPAIRHIHVRTVIVPSDNIHVVRLEKVGVMTFW